MLCSYTTQFNNPYIVVIQITWEHTLCVVLILLWGYKTCPSVALISLWEYCRYETCPSVALISLWEYCRYETCPSVALISLWEYCRYETCPSVALISLWVYETCPSVALISLWGYETCPSVALISLWGYETCPSVVKQANVLLISSEVFFKRGNIAYVSNCCLVMYLLSKKVWKSCTWHVVTCTICKLNWHHAMLCSYTTQFDNPYIVVIQST